MRIQTTKVYAILQDAVNKGYTTISEQGSARCFARDTLIRMADGTLKPVQDICVGDKVMAHTGEGYNVVTSTHSGMDNMYRVKQARGIDYVVNSRHILSLTQVQAKQKKVAIEGYKSAEKRKIVSLPYDRTTIHDFPVEEFMAQSKNFQRLYGGHKNTMITLPEKKVLIPPYYLGVWLGDGVATYWNAIANVDEEVLSYVYEFAKELDTEAYYAGSNTHRIRIVEKGTHNKALGGKSRAMRDAFRHYDLLGNKHIPEDYIYNSYECRLQLLAGLLDTDGYISKRGTYVLTQKNRGILEGVLEICRLSGFYTNGITSKIAKMKRKDGSVYECKVYNIEINHNDFKDLHQYMRLKTFEKHCDRDYFSTSIQIEPCGYGEYFGFTLADSPYFLLEDGTLAHNSGKTWNTLIWLIVYCLNNPKTTVSIVRKTNPALTGSVMRDFISIIQDMGFWDRRDFNKSSQMYTFQNGSWVEFFSTDDEQKLRGRKRQILYVNEANELLEIEYKQLKMRTTKFTIVDYNPSFGEEHWLNTINEDPRTYHFITTYNDNPFLEQVIIDEIESYKETNPSLWRIYGLGLRAIVEGLVFENWDIVDDFPYCDKEGIGLDFGYSKDPTAGIRCGLTGNDFYLDELFYRTHMLTSEISAELQPWDLDVIADSADPRLIDEIFNEQILIYPVQKFGGSVMAGIMKMLEFRIHVTKRSVNIIRELKNYTYQQDKNGNWLNKPIDAWNHALDAARYWVLAEVLGHVSKVVNIRESDIVCY